MTAEIITTRTDRIWLREDGLIQVVTLPHIQTGLADAQENIAVIARLCSEKRRPKLVDMRASRGIEREARAYYSSAEGVKPSTALALLVESPVTRVMANFFISLNKPAIPTRLFTSETEAIAWLKNFIE